MGSKGLFAKMGPNVFSLDKLKFAPEEFFDRPGGGVGLRRGGAEPPQHLFPVQAQGSGGVLSETREKAGHPTQKGSLIKRGATMLVAGTGTTSLTNAVTVLVGNEGLVLP